MAKQLYGRGTIEEIIKGKKYRIQQPAGKDPVSGKYLRIRETFLGTRRQAEMRLEQIRRELEAGRRVDADKITFAEWLGQYLELRIGSGKYRPKTLKQDRSNGKHLLRGFGSVLVVDITPAMVDAFYASMRKDGIGDTTVKQVHKMLKRVLDYAVRNDIILRNPVDRVESPKKPKPHRRALDAAEARKLINLCSTGAPTASKTAVFLGLSLGARLGEVLGITWGNIVLEGERPFVHIVQQFTDGGRIAPLKTDEDDSPNPGRIVPLDTSTVMALCAWRSEQRKQLNALGIEQGGDTPVITSSIGSFLGHSRFRKWWQSFCVENGYGRWVSDDGLEVVTLRIGDDASLHPGCIIEWVDSAGWPCDASGKRFSRSYKRPKITRHYDGLKFHELRHTHFTMRLASGMDIPTAQALGGWSTPDVLLNVYAHPVSQNVWDSVGFMDKLTEKQTA